MKQPIYKITLLKWREHNPAAKKHFKKTMIEHRLVNDAKINALPLSHKWLFINLLLICGEHANDTVTLTKRQVNDILTTREGASNALARLQSFQLISFEEMPLIEEKRREEKRKEENSAEPSNLVPLVPSVPKEVLIKIADNHHVEVSRGLILSWADTYPKDFLDLEVKKARSWLLANPHKSPKSNFGRFFNSWFNRAWEDYRKSLKSNPVSMTVDDLNDLLGAS